MQMQRQCVDSFVVLLGPEGLFFVFNFKNPKTIKKAEEDAQLCILFCILYMGQRERRVRSLKGGDVRKKKQSADSSSQRLAPTQNKRG